jgi:hypothetical protein
VGAVAMADLVKSTLGPKGMVSLRTSCCSGSSTASITAYAATAQSYAPAIQASGAVLSAVSMMSS